MYIAYPNVNCLGPDLSSGGQMAWDKGTSSRGVFMLKILCCTPISALSQRDIAQTPAKDPQKVVHIPNFAERSAPNRSISVTGFHNLTPGLVIRKGLIFDNKWPSPDEHKTQTTFLHKCFTHLAAGQSQHFLQIMRDCIHFGDVENFSTVFHSFR